MNAVSSSANVTRPLLSSSPERSPSYVDDETVCMLNVPLSGTFSTSVHLIKIGLGTGVLTLGYGADVAGVLGCGIVLVIVAALNILAIHLLVQCQYTIDHRVDPNEHNPRGKYSQIAYEAFGHWGVWMTDFFVVLTLMGAATAYFVFVETTMVHVVPEYPFWFWVLISYPVCIMLVVSDNLGYLAPVSVVAIFSTIIGMFSVFAYGASQSPFSLPAGSWMKFEGLPQCFGLCVYTFGHPVIIFPIYDQMHNREKKFMPTVVMSLSALVGFFTLIGVLSVGFFHNVGVMQNSITQLPSGSIVAKVVQTAMSIVVLLSYPLTMFVVNKMVFQYVRFWFGSPSVQLDYAVRIVLVTIAAIGALIIPHLADVVTILGCFTITFLCFINPFGFYLKLHQDTLAFREKILLKFGIVGGICVMLYTTHAAVSNMLHEQ
eukprot:CFRG6831T1